jgi:hypothetical protein
MRGTLLSFMGWLGMLQSWRPAITPSDDMARIVAMASLLSTLTIFVYRLGIWRQEMENMRNNVGAEVKGYREESVANFDRLERRLEAIDHLIALSSERGLRTARLQARAARRIEKLEAERAS